MDRSAGTITWVTDHLAVGHAPMSYDDLNSLKAVGIVAILNLCAEFCDLHEIERQAGFEVYYLPVVDEEAPEMAELEMALSWLDEAIYLGKKVLIHCRHGIGRTGTVLNAYLLRRGLGHKLADKALKGLRSKPTNFDQWWTVRKYGRKETRLSIREPSLESKNLVDLTPFFADFNRLVEKVEDLVLQKLGHVGRCGSEHHRCGSTPISLTLIEAVHITHALNTKLTSNERLAAIERAVAAAVRERDTSGSILAEGDFCLIAAGSVCPLFVDRGCQLFSGRPLQCRTFELTDDQQAELWTDLLQPVLDRLSEQLFLAFATTFAPEKTIRFALADVVSGKYVELFFKLLLSARINRTGP